VIHGNTSPLLKFRIVFFRGDFAEETAVFVEKRKAVYQAK